MDTFAWEIESSDDNRTLADRLDAAFNGETGDETYRPSYVSDDYGRDWAPETAYAERDRGAA
jgi:hypothetical protein